MTRFGLGRATWLATLLVLGGASLAGCGRGETPEAAANQANTRGRGGPGGPRTAVVDVAPVERGSISRSVSVSGVIEPIRTVAINSQLAGALRAVNVEEGDRVREGAVLARLDDRELRAQLAAAQAAFQVAEAAYERARQLREQKVFTLPEYERDRTAYTAARAQLDQLRTRVDFSVVNAPISGTVTEKLVEAGDVVGPQTHLFSLADVSTLVVRVGVSELDVVELDVGDPATLALDAFPGREFRGRIRRVFPAADPTTRLVPVEVALQEDDARVARPGFLARVSFALGARGDVLLIPASALVGGGGSEAVFVVENGKALRRTVTTGMTSAGRVEIVDGLQPGEQVVTAGNNSLRDGADVRVVHADSAGAGAIPAGSSDE